MFSLPGHELPIPEVNPQTKLPPPFLSPWREVFSHLLVKTDLDDERPENSGRLVSTSGQVNITSRLPILGLLKNFFFFVPPLDIQNTPRCSSG